MSYQLSLEKVISDTNKTENNCRIGYNSFDDRQEVFLNYGFIVGGYYLNKRHCVLEYISRIPYIKRPLSKIIKETNDSLHLEIQNNPHLWKPYQNFPREIVNVISSYAITSIDCIDAKREVEKQSLLGIPKSKVLYIRTNLICVSNKNLSAWREELDCMYPSMNALFVDCYATLKSKFCREKVDKGELNKYTAVITTPKYLQMFYKWKRKRFKGPYDTQIIETSNNIWYHDTEYEYIWERFFAFDSEDFYSDVKIAIPPIRAKFTWIIQKTQENMFSLMLSRRLGYSSYLSSLVSDLLNCVNIFKDCIVNVGVEEYAYISYSSMVFEFKSYINFFYTLIMNNPRKQFLFILEYLDWSSTKLNRKLVSAGVSSEMTDYPNNVRYRFNKKITRVAFVNLDNLFMDRCYFVDFDFLILRCVPSIDQENKLFQSCLNHKRVKDLDVYYVLDKRNIKQASERIEYRNKESL